MKMFEEKCYTELGSELNSFEEQELEKNVEFNKSLESTSP